MEAIQSAEAAWKAGSYGGHRSGNCHGNGPINSEGREPKDVSMTRVQVRSLIESAVAGSLGTLGSDGSPFVSLVTVTATGPTKLAMLLSGLAVHTKNLIVRPTASILLVAPGGESGDPLAGARVTLMGTVRKLPRNEDDAVRGTFLAKHLTASMYADFGDFAFFEFVIDQAHLVAGFGRIETISADQL